MEPSRHNSDRQPAPDAGVRDGFADAERETLCVEDDDILVLPAPVEQLRGRMAAVPSNVNGPSSSAPSASDDDLRFGGLLAGKYRLERPLGEGGMGTVWLGRNEKLELDVAIKIIRADIEIGNLGARLLNEARAAAKLRHPGIVRVLDFGSTSTGLAYLVMERLTGPTLHQHLETFGRLEAASAVALMLPAAAALDAAHRKRIVHRDFKPENLILAEGDDHRVEPKVVDFGVATQVREQPERLTSQGGVVGSPHYLSPEQAMGMQVDHRTDIWSFAVVLYEAIANRLPFGGENYHALLQSIIHSPAPPLNEEGLADDALWAIIERGLAKKPTERWDSMQDLGSALARWLLERDISVDVTRRSIRAAWFPEQIASAQGLQGITITPGSPPPPSPRHSAIVVRNACSVDGGRPRRGWRIALAAMAGSVAAIGLSLWLRGSESAEPSRGVEARTAGSEQRLPARTDATPPTGRGPGGAADTSSEPRRTVGENPAVDMPTPAASPSVPRLVSPSAKPPLLHETPQEAVADGPEGPTRPGLRATALRRPHQSSASSEPFPEAAGLEIKTEF